MSTKNRTPAMPDWLKDHLLVGLPVLSDRDSACIVLQDLDYGAQLEAIRNLIQGQRLAEHQTAEEISEMEEHAKRLTGMRNEVAVDEWIERLHHSVYQDAAHSMAALGMIAPLIESIFHQAFLGMKAQFFSDGSSPPNHARWITPNDGRWDCHFVWHNGKRSKRLVEGIIQLSDAVGLSPRLPAQLDVTLQALFEYRNKMFHCGFEWPVDERERFGNRVKAWPTDWFAKSMRGEVIWIFYLTHAFITHCLEMIEKVIDGIGAFCKQMLSLDSPSP